MAIPVACPHCQARFRVKDENCGKQGKCPKCGGVFVVPAVVNLSSALPESPVAKVIAPPAGPVPAEPSRPLPAPFAGGTSDPLASGPLAAATVVGSGSGVSQYARRRNGWNVPIWVWALVATLGLAGAVGAAWWQNNQTQSAQRKQKLRAKNEQRRAVDRNQQRLPDQNTTQLMTPAPAAPKLVKPAAGASREDVIAYIEHGIVLIESYDEWNVRRGVGSGFVIDANGLVATNYHVVSKGLKADVLFNDGTRYGVLGYAAVAPEHDLALLQLNGTPPNMAVLDLQAEGTPRKASDIYAIGHPHNHKFVTTSGIVGQVTTTSELPAESQAFLRQALGDQPEIVWIEHNAQISAGNSGGPLINAQGEVLGVNTWVNEPIKLGFAIHARHLRELQGRRLRKLASLQEYWRGEPGSRQIAYSAGAVQKLFEICSVQDWSKAGESDFAKLGHLAAVLTVARAMKANPQLSETLPPQHVQAFLDESEGVAESLATQHWDTETQIKPINAHAASPPAAAGVPGELHGAFLFGAIDQVQQRGQQRGLLVSLTGFDRKFFVSVPQSAGEPEVGAAVLIVGVLENAVYRYGDEEQPQEAPVIQSQLVTPLPP